MAQLEDYLVAAPIGQAVGGTDNVALVGVKDPGGNRGTLRADASGNRLASLDQTTPGTTDRATVGKTVYVNVDLTLDTSPYAAGDLLADTQSIANLFRAVGLGGVLMSMEVIDKDDQGAGFSVIFVDANVSFGTENAPPSISDTDAQSILGRADVTTADYLDLGGVRVASIKNIGLALQPASGTRDGYLAVINGAGTPTYTASGICLRLGMLLD